MKEVINAEYLENMHYCGCLVDFKKNYKGSYSLIDFARLKKITWDDRRDVIFYRGQGLLSDKMIRDISFEYAALVVSDCDIPEVLDFFYYVEDIFKVHNDIKLVFGKKFHDLYKKSFDASDAAGNFIYHRVVNALASRDVYESVRCIESANIDDKVKSDLVIHYLRNNKEYNKGFKPNVVYMGVCLKTGKNMHKYKGHFSSYRYAYRAFGWKVDKGEVEIIKVNYAEKEIEKTQQKINRLYKAFEKTSLKHKNQIKKLKEASLVKNLTH